MNAVEAKQILLLYRPQDAADPEMTAALELTRQDPELKQWFDQHCAFQQAVRTNLRRIQPPPHLKDALLAQMKVVAPPWWQRPAWLAAAAAVMLLAGIWAVWQPAAPLNQFANFQQRMISTAQREYRMDLLTSDMTRLRQFIARQGAPADYNLTRGLEKLALTGGGLLHWRNNPVAMVCFDRGDKQMLFLFVMKKAAVKDPPPETPQLAKVTNLYAMSWSHGDKTYLLAGPPETDFSSKYQ